MSDLIDRQAAIDAVRSYYDAEYCLDSIEELIEKLPSVQPETTATFPVDGEPIDCISRQHAILAIERNAYRREDINETEHIIKWVLDIIKWLPSTQELISEAHDTAWLDGYTAGQGAQSEYVALHESCTDCPLYDRKNHNCPRFNRVIPTAIRDAQPENMCVNLDIQKIATHKSDFSDLDELSSTQPEIIRCKDCKWCEDADGLICKNTASWVVATDYDFGCVCAERRQDERFNQPQSGNQGNR